MNMKKTIAAVAAGAVAVSAMATSVSALESKTLNYNLVAAVKEMKTGTVNLTATFGAVDPTGGIAIHYDAAANGLTINSITAKVTDNGSNKTKTFVASAAWGTENYDSSVGSGWYNITADELDIANTADKYEVDVTINVNHYLDEEWKGYGEIKAGSIEVDGTPVAAKMSGLVKSQKFFHKAPMQTGIVDNYDIVNYLGTKNVNGDEKSYINVLAVLNDAIENYEGVTFAFNTAKENVHFNIVTYNDNGTIKEVLKDADQNTRAKAQTTINDELVKAEKALGVAEANYATADKAFMASAANSKKTAWADADKDLKDAVKGADAPESAPGAGDAVTTYADMEAAAGALDDAKETKATWTAAKILPVYPTDSWKGTDEYKEFREHTYNDITGTGLYKGEGTKMTGYDWAGTNLFGGALIINEKFTMSLADTKYFDLAGTTLSFNWEDVMADAKTENNYATYLQTLKLCTSTEWYWDSLDVVLAAAAEEDAPSIEDESNADGDGADIPEDEGNDDAADDDADADDDEINTDDAADDDADDDAADDDAADDDAADDNATAPEASNPETGNAPVALAVIPVALAAAAVVAKKRS